MEVNRETEERSGKRQGRIKNEYMETKAEAIRREAGEEKCHKTEKEKVNRECEGRRKHGGQYDALRASLVISPQTNEAAPRQKRNDERHRNEEENLGGKM